MRRHLFFVLAVLALPAFSLAQTGFPPFGSIDQIGLEYRNNQDLNVLLAIPIMSSPGRGGLNLNFSLVYNSSIWAPDGTIWLPSSNNAYFGWSTSFNTGASSYKYTTVKSFCNRIQGEFTYITTYSNYQYVDPYGTPHSFNLSWNYTDDTCTGQYTTTGTFTSYATDGSGYYATISASDPAPPKIYAPNGVVIASTSLTDVNGNYISSTTSGSETDWTDSAGRVALKIITGTSTIQYETLNPSGTYETTTLNLENLNFKTNFGCSGITEYSGTVSLPQSLVLPNGQTYTFAYEPTPGNSGYSTGRLQQVTLPTGGYYQYTYTGNNDGINCADGTTLSMSRTASDGTNTATWNYVRNTTNLSTTITTPKLADTPQANDMVITFNSSNQETSRKIYANSPGSGTPLRTINTTWAANGTPATKITILDDGSTQSEVATTYNSNGLLSSVSEYNFGSGAPGSLFRTTTYAYETSTNYTNLNLINLVTSKQILDGGGTVRYRQDTSYDSAALQNCPAGAPQHNDAGFPCSFNYRGNPTMVLTYLSPATQGNAAITQFTYDWFGNLIKAQDALNNPTTISYSDSWVDSTCPPSNNTYAYPTSVSNALSQTTSLKYYACVGLVGSVTDPNNQTTTILYDVYKRPSQENFPDGGQTTWAYSGATSATTTTKMNSSQNIVSTVLLDGLGRPSQTQLNSDPLGVDYTTTVYDLIGRPYQVYNPTRCNPPTSSCGESTWGYSTSALDALGRATSVTLQDGSVTSAAYSANTTTATDPAGKKRTTTADSAGRLAQVTEDPGGLGYVTTYSYDALNNLMSVVQNGSRQRSFTYDAFSRLVCESNPEIQIATCPYPDNGSYTAGTIRYGYDYNGNLTSRQAPAPNQTGSSTVTTTYTYDTLNRLTQKSYSDGLTPTASFAYDISSPWGISVQNSVGRLVLASVSNAGTVSSYDPMGRTLNQWECTPIFPCGSGSYFWLGYSYNFVGEQTSLNYDGGFTMSQAYDSAGRVVSLSNSQSDPQHPSPLVTVDSSVGYYPHGALRKMIFGNGLTQATQIEPRLQPCEINLNSSGSALTACGVAPNGTIQDHHYVFGSWGSTNNGDVTAWIGSGTQNFSRSYSFDGVNRLSTLSSPSDPNGCTGLSWTYDAWGNRTDQTVTGGSCPSFHQTFNSQNRMANSPYQYDAAGNLIADGNHTYTYDAENRLTQVDGGSTAAYIYDASGRRVEKIQGSNQEHYWYDVNGNVRVEWNQVPDWMVDYLYLGSQKVAEYRCCTTYFVHTDHLGSTRLLTDADQSVAQNLDYLPFGELNSTDSGITAHKFTGLERDSETDLDHTWFRQYASSTARWMTPDPAGLAAVDPTDPQTWNRYAYVRNIPVLLTDAFGLTPSCNTAKNHDTSQPQDSKSGGGPSASDMGGAADPDPQGNTDCEQTPWYDGAGGGGMDPFFGGGWGGGPFSDSSIYNQPFVGFSGDSSGDTGGLGFLLGNGGGGGGLGPWSPTEVGLTNPCPEFFNDGAGFSVYMGDCGGSGSGCTVNGRQGICVTSGALVDRSNGATILIKQQYIRWMYCNEKATAQYDRRIDRVKDNAEQADSPDNPFGGPLEPGDEGPPVPSDQNGPSWYAVVVGFYHSHRYNNQRAACTQNNPLAVLYP